MKGRCYALATALGLAISLLIAPIPAQAQGKGHGNGQGNGQGNGRGNGHGNDHGNADNAEHAQSHGSGRGNFKAQPQARSVHGTPGNYKNHGSAVAQQARAYHSSHAAMRGTLAPENAAAPYRRDYARFTRSLTISEIRPSMRPLVESNNAQERLAASAVAYALARGTNPSNFMIVPNGNQVFVRNRRGDPLLNLDEARARNMGNWMVNVLDNRTSKGAPSFCRSGAGHPVWGRQWCLDKGFGLGTERDLRWGFTDNLDQSILLNPGTTTGSIIVGDALARILGPTVTDRLALHAITLGLADPLVGRWLGDPNGQRVLQVSSGRTPVAELTDVNRDNLADRLLVALRSW